MTEVIGEDGRGADPYYLTPGMVNPLARNVNPVGGPPIGRNVDAADRAAIAKLAVTLHQPSTTTGCARPIGRRPELVFKGTTKPGPSTADGC